MKNWGVVGVVLFMAGCAPAPLANYPLLIGASLPTDPAPPPINRSLPGFGDLTFGMSPYGAAHHGYSEVTDNSGTYLAGNPKIDGINYLERLNFDGTPAQLSSISLGSDGLNLNSSGNPTCPSAQTLFNDLLNKYGPEQTWVDDALGAGNGTNTYTWTFEGGRTIELVDTEGYCPMIIYAEADAPQKTPGL